MALRSTERVRCMRLLQQVMKIQTGRACSTVAFDHNDPHVKIGKREVVGYGHNGGLNYIDRVDFPMPAVRFRESNNEILVLREKEKGDWKKLTIEEKKGLYRASFCQTFTEMEAPTGEWKLNISGIIIALSLACWLYMGLRAFVLPPLPESFSEENVQKRLRKMVELQVNPIDGLSSKYDYEKGRWK